MASPAKLTVEELMRLAEDGSSELDEQQVIVKPPAGIEHGDTQETIAWLLSSFVREHNLGKVLIGTGFVLAPDTLREPDLAFVSDARRESYRRLKPWLTGAPELAVEIISPWDKAVQLLRKVRQFLQAGTKAVWIAYPESRTVWVFEAGGAARVLEPGNVLEAPQILPGFSVPVERLFE